MLFLAKALCLLPGSKSLQKTVIASRYKRLGNLGLVMLNLFQHLLQKILKQVQDDLILLDCHISSTSLLAMTVKNLSTQQI
jgi:hypothetical protein